MPGSHDGPVAAQGIAVLCVGFAPSLIVPRSAFAARAFARAAVTRKEIPQAVFVIRRWIAVHLVAFQFDHLIKPKLRI